MNEKEIKKIKDLAEKMKVFSEEYSEIKLFANLDGEVESDKLLSWLIKNSFMMELVNNIKKLL